MAGSILVTGGEGQVARALADLAQERGLALSRVGRPDFDFDRPETVNAAVRAAAPSFIVNAAAYTAVDAAETDEAAAYRANRDGPARLAALAAELNIPLIHISTDYVFDGEKGAPYIETDPTSPTGVYGASKLAGEAAVLDTSARAIVLRTSWVYAANGKNFVLTMLNAAKRMAHLRVVADQKGCPTAAPDLAAGILDIIERITTNGWQSDYRGVYHASGTGWTTWHGLAVAVFNAASSYGVEVPVVEKIATLDWPTPARRPHDSRLDCSKLFTTFNLSLPDWTSTLPRIVSSILAPPSR